MSRPLCATMDAHDEVPGMFGAVANRSPHALTGPFVAEGVSPPPAWRLPGAAFNPSLTLQLESASARPLAPPLGAPWRGPIPL